MRGAQDELRPEDLAHQPLDHLALLRGAWLKRDDVAEHVALRTARVTALAGPPMGKRQRARRVGLALFTMLMTSWLVWPAPGLAPPGCTPVTTPLQRSRGAVSRRGGAVAIGWGGGDRGWRRTGGDLGGGLVPEALRCDVHLLA